jgi:hypothetical protein
MNEIYWITRLDSIKTVSVICIIAGVICLAALLIMWIGLYDENTETIEFINKMYKKPLRWAAILLLSIGIPVTVFVPSTKSALLIYGLGGTIDYLRSNEKASKLPDKVIDYLDAWMEKQIEEEETQNSRRK